MYSRAKVLACVPCEVPVGGWDTPSIRDDLTPYFVDTGGVLVGGHDERGDVLVIALINDEDRRQ